ncbi:hypothetical protein ABZ801_13370 [Actinomadura sp. NPDC047616]|uniref:hypothetical protein n=1 Tax=Actinomadura sp. NPDC047616 TaxID=3155914 RepID=UPI0033E4481C
MTVTDDQIATLRALLSGNFEEYDRLSVQIEEVDDSRSYTALVAAAFFKAAYQRFVKAGSIDDVVEYVGDVRSRFAGVADQLDPRTAERVILATVADENIDDLDGRTIMATEFLLLAALVADRNFDEVELNDFLSEARKLADEWLR